MRKLLFSLLFCLICYLGHSQFVNTTPRGQAVALDENRGGGINDSGFIISKILYTDTTSANYCAISHYQLAVACTYNGGLFQEWIRTLNPNVWHLIPSGAIPATFNPIAGYAIIISGTYPNITFTVDTSKVTTIGKLYQVVDSVAVLKLNIADTTAMLSNYFNNVGYGLGRSGQTVKADTILIVPYTDTLKVNGIATKTFVNSIVGTDTTSLSNRINLRVKYTDTATMLLPYLPKWDSTYGGFYPYATNPKGYLTSGTGAASVSNSDGSLTISPTTGNVVASLNTTTKTNTWTPVQNFNSLTLLPQGSATPNPASGNTLFDSSGLGWRGSNGSTVRLSKALIGANTMVTDSFSNESGTFILNRDTASMLSPYKTYYPRTAISLTTTGTSGVSTYNNSTGVFNIPNYAASTGDSAYFVNQYGSNLSRQTFKGWASDTIQTSTAFNTVTAGPAQSVFNNTNSTIFGGAGNGSARVTVGFVGYPEANLGFNFNYPTISGVPTHRFFDTTIGAIWLGMGPTGGFGMQYAPNIQGISPTADVWILTGNRYLYTGDTSGRFSINTTISTAAADAMLNIRRYPNMPSIGGSTTGSGSDSLIVEGGKNKGTIAPIYFNKYNTGGLFAPNLFSQGSGTDSILVKNTSSGQFKLIAQGSISGVVKYTDTSSMLSPYLRKTDTSTMLAGLSLDRVLANGNTSARSVTVGSLTSTTTGLFGASVTISPVNDAYLTLNAGSTSKESALVFDEAATDKWKISKAPTTHMLNIFNFNTGVNSLSISNSTDAATFANSVTATALITSGGTSSQYVKGDGTLGTYGSGVGTVTSVSTNTGSGITGGTITTTGTIAADTTILSTRLNVLKQLNPYLTTSTAASTYLQLSAGNSPLTGNLGISTSTATLDLIFSGNTNFKHSLIGANYSGTAASNELDIKVASGSSTQVTPLKLFGDNSALFASLGTGQVYSTAGTLTNTAPAGTGNVRGTFSATGTATTTFTVTIGQTMLNTNYYAAISPNEVLTAAAWYINNYTTTTFDVVFLTGLTGTVTFKYLVVP